MAVARIRKDKSLGYGGDGGEAPSCELLPVAEITVGG
jgi:hypothetical protein